MKHLFIVGAAKAGTTSLVDMLSGDSRFNVPALKEPHYFSSLPNGRRTRQMFGRLPRTIAEYEYLYVNGTGVRVDGSTSYLYDASSAQRLRDYSPDSTILVLVRDPIQRAISHVLMDVRQGMQRLSPYEAILADYSASRKGYFVSHLYVELGLYATQISRYLDVFPTKSVIIVSSSELWATPVHVMARIESSLGLPIGGGEPYILPRLNPRSAPNRLLGRALSMPGVWPLRSAYRSHVPAELRSAIRRRVFRDANLIRVEPSDPAIEFLRDVYLEPNKRLERLLGTTVPELWKSFPTGMSTTPDTSQA